MPVDVVVLVVAAVLAVVALVAAVVALRAVREVKALREQTDVPVEWDVRTVETANAPSKRPTQRGDAGLRPGRYPHTQRVRGVEKVPAVREAAEPQEARVIEGRVIVPPTQEQVVAAQMTRPSVRLTIVLSGLAHALRPESRDRISGLVRREYRQRRRARQRAGRRAARATNNPPTQTDGWMSS
ncbi:hypothetical protein BHE97_09750 [Aeromicrobium sp. PE09-221]|uniref:hypothetical protein n=1 Tax=Aeromicrobium sp. PE09-221 TaxID=1898043 RepID=UPI000B3ED224|nr:hypothetical protein [Aeromicrobium sp. PE09-221]OUZ09731.1 hypothetical protein BHE97_09750 [Aeromicrobium sp. PE09-221]